MEDTNLDSLIVDRLSKSASKNDLIMEICETRHISWSEAEALVLRVQSEHEHTIAGRRFPLLFILALGIFLAGLAMVLYQSYLMYSIWDTSLGNMFTDTDIFSALPMRMFLDYALGPLAGILFGAAMMLGSIVGMRRAWIPILDHLTEKKVRRQ